MHVAGSLVETARLYTAPGAPPGPRQEPSAVVWSFQHRDSLANALLRLIELARQGRPSGS